MTDKARSEFLDFNIQFSRIAVQNRLGDFRSAASGLERLKLLRTSTIYQARRWAVEQLEGNINEGMGQYAAAEGRYSKSYRNLVEREEWRGASFAALDLAALYSRQDMREEMLNVVSKLIPILDSLELHPETVAAVALLSKALADGRIQYGLLAEVRSKLQSDPLLRLS